MMIAAPVNAAVLASSCRPVVFLVSKRDPLQYDSVTFDLSISTALRKWDLQTAKAAFLTITNDTLW